MTIPVLRHDNLIAGVLRGFAFRYVCDLKRDDLAFNLEGCTVQARVLSADSENKIGDPIACISTAEGANWPLGRLVVIIPSATTALMSEDDAMLQIIVTDVSGEKWPWMAPVSVRSGGPSLG